MINVIFFNTRVIYTDSKLLKPPNDEKNHISSIIHFLLLKISQKKQHKQPKIKYYNTFYTALKTIIKCL